MRKLLRLLAALLILALLAVLLVPWHRLLQGQLIALMRERGFENPQLEVTGLSFSAVTLEHVQIGAETPLTFKKLTLDYSPLELWEGRLGMIALSDLLVTLHKQPEGWGVSGVKADPAHPGEPITLPVSDAELPLAQLTVQNSALAIDAGTWQANLPLALTFAKQPDTKLAYNGKALGWKSGDIEAAGNLTAHLTLDEKARTWRGEWSADTIILKGVPLAIPPSAASGTLTATAGSVALKGGWATPDKAYFADFSLTYSLATPATSTFTLQRAGLPWGGGKVSVRNAAIPLDGSAFTLAVELKDIAIAEVLGPVTGGKASATGTLSGTLPLRVGPEGVTPMKGALAAVSPGVIRMSPEAIPGDNPQVALLREVMTNLNYTSLSLEASPDPKHKFAVVLAVEGSNPELQGGRPVKLRVQLAGDVLDFIRQNLALQDPQSLLKTHGK